MKFLASLAATAVLITSALADFQIYYMTSNVVNADGGYSTVDSFSAFDGPPSCDDVNNNYATMPVAGDASSAGYSRCDGCGSYGDRFSWDIKELELHAQGDWGHYTIYENAGYQLTPADGGPLQGSCTRDYGTDTVDCTTGIDQSQGTRMFICSSPKNGYHAR